MVKIKIINSKCTVCGGCIDLCPEIAINMIDDIVTINDDLCTECGTCINICPLNAPYTVE